VPTVWLAVADALERRGITKLPELRYVLCGGSQPPRPLIERYQKDFGVTILQAWGMTETSPLGAVAWPRQYMRDWDEDRLIDAVRVKAGTPPLGVEISILDADGERVPRDGSTPGRLLIRGPWVADSYYKDEYPESFTEDGWLDTGDVAVHYPDGEFTIVDRTKDLVKSGGEWISSLAMEAAVLGVPGVQEVAVIAVPDPRWQERPLPCIVLDAGVTLDVELVRTHLAQHGWPNWQLPERLEILDALPKTTVGKLDKRSLRARFASAEFGDSPGAPEVRVS
jgi:fatty-acyl-CoA synthase